MIFDSIIYPDNIIIYGGGRWARVYIDVLINDPNCKSTIYIYTAYNKSKIYQWLKTKKVSKNKICFIDKLFKANKITSSVLIIINKSSNHFKSSLECIKLGYNLIVEKPITRNYNDSLKLFKLSKEKKLNIIPSSIFLFSRYIKNFKKIINKNKNINYITITWSDIVNESRYGENKLIDHEIMIYEDFLHHIIPIFRYLFGDFPKYSKIKKIYKGGAKVDLEFNFKNIPVLLKLDRKSENRERLILIKGDDDDIYLDFSSEPGFIINGSEKYIADDNWDKLDKPLISMIKFYFNLILSKKSNLKINKYLNNSMKTIEIIESISMDYFPLQIKSFNSHQYKKDDYYYIANELKKNNFI